LELDQLLQIYLENEKIIKKGRRLFNKKKYLPALESFRIVAKRYPENQIIYDYIRLCEKSIEYNQKTVKTQADVTAVLLRHKNIEYNLKQGKLANEQEKYELSIELYKKVLVEVPEHALAIKYIELNKKYLALKREEEKAVLEQKEWMLKAHKLMAVDQRKLAYVEDNVKKGLKFFDKGQYQLASQRFLAVLKKSPKHRVAIEYLAIAQKYLHMRAQVNLNKIIAIKVAIEAESQSYFVKGKDLFQKKQYKDAIKKFAQAWELSPSPQLSEQVQAYIEKSFELERKGVQKTQEEELAKKNAQYQEIYRKARVLYESKKYKDSIQLFQKALFVFPLKDDPRVAVYVQKCYEGIEAQKLAKEQAELKPIYDLGLRRFREEHWLEALKLLSQVHVRDPKFKDVRLYFKLTQKKLEESLS
jgi:tetratricopeptide (TPR) repeat protein